MCKDDYPPILAELEEFHDVLDCGCGTGPMIELLHEKYPDKHYVGLDLTPRNDPCGSGKKSFQYGISRRRQRKNLPLQRVLLMQLFAPTASITIRILRTFFNSAYRVLKKGGRLVLRDYTSSDFVVWLMNHLEMPLANLVGHGDVKIHKASEFISMAQKAGFTVLTMEKQKGFRAHLVARK